MPSIAPLSLQDSSGQTWLTSVTNAAQLVQTPTSGIGITAISISDVSSSQLWSLSVWGPGPNWGLLKLTPITGAATFKQIPILAPNGTLFAIQVDSSAPMGTSPIQVAIADALCPFSLGDADGALADRLYDLTGQFWTQAERYLYIRETLRTWNALTGYWRGDFTFQTQQDSAWYDMTDGVAMPNSLRPLTLTGVDLATMIEYHLLEPPVGAGPWTGSAQFSITDITQAIQRRRNEVIGVTGCQISRILIPAVPGRTSLPSTVIDLRRVAFFPADGSAPSILWQDDTWALQSFQGDFTVTPPGIPIAFTISTEPWLTFDTDIPPLPGQYELLVVEAGTVSPTSDTLLSSLNVPDDWTWVIKWGALADLLSRESNAKDIPRAQYCEQRYQMGLKLLVIAPALLAARVGNQPLQVDAVKGADEYQTDWQGRTHARPDTLLVAGLNLLATAPSPDAGPYSITATVVENAPMPTDADSCLLLDRSLFDVVVDYAQHLAMFKCGGAEFATTVPLLQRFLRAAALYSSKLSEMGEFSRTLFAVSQQEAAMNPRYSADNDPAEADA